jgi:hypothetical protein
MTAHRISALRVVFFIFLEFRRNFRSQGHPVHLPRIMALKRLSHVLDEVVRTSIQYQLMLLLAQLKVSCIKAP